MIAIAELKPAPGEVVWIDYTNWRGERAVRQIRPQALVWGCTQYHPKPQWLLQALDMEKGEPRGFALCDIGRISAEAFSLPVTAQQYRRSELLAMFGADFVGATAIARKGGCCQVCIDPHECIERMQCKLNLSTLTKITPD